jgi:hypothetical protein
MAGAAKRKAEGVVSIQRVYDAAFSYAFFYFFKQVSICRKTAQIFFFSNVQYYARMLDIQDNI